MTKPRGLCQLSHDGPAVATVGGFRLCSECIARIRAIATDAGVTIDEQMLNGGLRILKKRTFTRAMRAIEDTIERREIAAARGGG